MSTLFSLPRSTRAGRTVFLALVEQVVEETTDPWERERLGHAALWFTATTIGIPGYDEQSVLDALEDGTWRNISICRVSLDVLFNETAVIFETACLLGEPDQLHDAVRIGAGLRLHFGGSSIAGTAPMNGSCQEHPATKGRRVAVAQRVIARGGDR